MPATPPHDPIVLLKRLIRCASVTPETDGVLDVLEEVLTGLGFAVTRLRFEGGNSYPVDNLFATLGRGFPHLLLAGHTDVVPPGDVAAWAHPPFAAEEADGQIYGRGAADMKSGIAAFVAAAADFAGERGRRGTLSLAITNDEEADGVNGTEKILAWASDQGIKFDFAIVGEPSSSATVGDTLKIGRRGSLNGEITVTGVQGHAAYPENAINPIPVAAALVTAFKSTPFDPGTARFPPTNLELTSIDVGNEAFNVIPGQVRVRFNIRFNDRWTPEKLVEWLNKRIENVATRGVTIELKLPKRPSRSFISPSGGAVMLLAKAVAAKTGILPDLSTTGGTSDARFIAPYCPVAELGLVGSTMHKTDEHVSIDDVRALVGLYREFMDRFFAQPEPPSAIL